MCVWERAEASEDVSGKKGSRANKQGEASKVETKEGLPHDTTRKKGPGRTWTAKDIHCQQGRTLDSRIIRIIGSFRVLGKKGRSRKR